MRTDLGDPLPRGLEPHRRADRQPARGRDRVGQPRREHLRRLARCRDATGNFLPVLMYTRNVGPTLGTGVRWFILASVLVLLARSARGRSAQPPPHQAADRRHRGHGPHRRGRPRRCACRTTAAAATDELDDLAKSINEMADSLARSRGLEQQFLLSVSHDLRTPLTSIQGYAEAIADGAVPDDRAAAGDHPGRVPSARAAGPRPARPGQARGPPVLARPRARRPRRPGERLGRRLPPRGRGRRAAAAPGPVRPSGRRRRRPRPPGPGRGQPHRERPEVRVRVDHRWP